MDVSPGLLLESSKFIIAYSPYSAYVNLWECVCSHVDLHNGTWFWQAGWERRTPWHFYNGTLQGGQGWGYDGIWAVALMDPNRGTFSRTMTYNKQYVVVYVYVIYLSNVRKIYYFIINIIMLGLCLWARDDSSNHLKLHVSDQNFI